jgi:hypothetical protein
MTATRISNGATDGGTGLAQVTFDARYEFIEVSNLGMDISLFVRTDGNAATVGGGDDDYCILPGEKGLIANQLELWYQGFGAMDETQNNPGTQVNLAAQSAIACRYSVAGVA